jgi:hypothetical protein
MKSNHIFKTLLAMLVTGLTLSAHAESTNASPDAVEMVRSIYKSDRQEFVANALQLSEDEGKAFWPLYQSYRADMDTIGDGLVKLVLEYRDLYPNITDADAGNILKQYLSLEKKLSSKRDYYFKHVSGKLPATKALRWVQLENRMNLALRLQLAGVVPVVADTSGKAGSNP